MAGRKPKEKLDYYSMDDGWIHDYKVRRYVRKTGFTGLGFYCYLIHEIYHQSYYIDYDEDFVMAAAEYGNIEEKRVVKLLDQMAEAGLIKKIDTEDGTILTSKGIQKRYLFIRNSLRRTQEFVPEIEFWLLDCDENGISATKTQQKLNFCNENDAELNFCTQKGKERKRKEKGKGKEREKEKEKEAEGWASDFKKPPTYGLPKKDCELCGGTGFIFKKDGDKDVTVYCDCRKEG